MTNLLSPQNLGSMASMNTAAWTLTLSPNVQPKAFRETKEVKWGVEKQVRVHAHSGWTGQLVAKGTLLWVHTAALGSSPQLTDHEQLSTSTVQLSTQAENPSMDESGSVFLILLTWDSAGVLAWSYKEGIQEDSRASPIPDSKAQMDSLPPRVLGFKL